jgi:nucleotide-binding universal stress UspA family protein
VQSVFDAIPFTLASGNNIAVESATEQLEEQSRMVSRVFKISCYAEVTSASQKLSAVIKEKARGFDLIVMGSNGADDLYQFFGGSNTYNALIKADVPVLVIPEGYGFSNIKTITYAFDYFREGNLALNQLLPFINALKCDLKVLQIMEESRSKEAEDYLGELQTVIQNLYKADIPITYDTIHVANIAQSINNYVLRNQPDALALCSVHRGFFGKLFHESVIRHITSICNYPVFVFHQ